jgi:predicted lipid-binding transport protein (Tim44 family)
MKKALAVFAVVLALGMTAALDAEARRLGGGKSSGMQRQNVTAPASQGGNAAKGAPNQAAPAAGTAAAAAPAAAAAKRSWMGPLAGLAAGIGLMALASHFGFGEAMANMMMIGLLVMAVLVVVGLVMRKRAAGRNPALAGAGGAGGLLRQQANTLRNDTGAQQRTGSLIGSGIGGSGIGAVATAGVGNIPADFDTAAFERNAKDRFVDLQAANDARDLTRLRDYLTPEMFEVVRAEVDSRGAEPQQTEVFGLEARVLDVAEEEAAYVVSVRLTGSLRQQHGAIPEDLDEIWHLTKPRSGFGGWVVAGIQQTEASPQA